MRVSINQPAYLPWLGYFNRIAISDVHVILDQVQFEKNSAINRNKIRTGNGWSWLTVPVKTKGKFGELEINSLEIDNASNWAEKHWKAICHNYGKTPYFEKYSSELHHMYSHPWSRLFDLMDEMNSYFIKEVLNLPTPLKYGSKLDAGGRKSDLVLNICRELGATTYISGPFGRDYLDEKQFFSEGIAIEYHDYVHPVYQQYYQPFEPYMSILDLIMNCGAGSRDVIMTNLENHQD
jgi:hypothetical protein